MSLVTLQVTKHTSLEGDLPLLRCSRKSEHAPTNLLMGTTKWPSFKILHTALLEIFKFEVYEVIYVVAILKFSEILEYSNFDNEETSSG